MNPLDNILFFSGSSHLKLAKEIADLLKKPLGEILLERFPDGETRVEVKQNVRGKNVFVLQSPVKEVDHYIMELLLIIDALKRASADKITVLMPYFAYGRQDKKTTAREPVSARLIANLLETAGATHVVTFDLHAPQVQGFFNIPVDNLETRPLLVEKIKSQVDVKNLVVVSPDVGRNTLARLFAHDLKASMAVVDKRRVGVKDVKIEALMGEVQEKDVLIVDDMMSTGSTLKAASKLCREGGAKKIYVALCHGPLIQELRDDAIDKIFTTNTTAAVKDPSVSVAPIYASAIKKMAVGDSLLPLYQGKF